jgi:hypothetical protein
MASQEMSKFHLKQSEIEGIVSIMEDLAPWLAATTFKGPPTGEIGKCSESKQDQREKLDPLFRAMGISSEVRAHPNA